MLSVYVVEKCVHVDFPHVCHVCVVLTLCFLAVLMCELLSSRQEYVPVGCIIVY
jgi:hypothetical protein